MRWNELERQDIEKRHRKNEREIIQKERLREIGWREREQMNERENMRGERVR